MKKTIALLLTLVMLSCIVAGCSGNQNGNAPQDNDPANTAAPAQTDEPQVVYEKTYKSTFSTSITSMNPYCTEFTSDYNFISNIAEGLVETDVYGRPSPCMAESWEHNDDFSVRTFRIRPDVYWVDCSGSKTEYKVTADDFVAGIRYIADPANNASGISTIRNVIAGLYDYYYALVDIDDGTDIGKTRDEVVASFDETVGVKAVDEYTVEYTLSGPCPYFLSYAQLDMMLPVEQAFLDSVGEDFGTSKETMLYNGGYYISAWDLDKQFVLTKNENYWDLDKLTIDTLQWEYVSDSISSLEMFQRGNITGTSLTSEEVASIRGGEWEDYVYLSEKTVTTYWYSWNFQTKNPEMAAAVQNENFRKAVFSAIDAITLSAIWEPNDPEFFCRYTLLPENAIFDDDGKDYTDYGNLPAYRDTDPYDVEKAQEYLKAAIAELCEADGVTLKGVTPGHVDMLPLTEFDCDGKLPIDIVYSSSSSDSDMKKATLVKNMLETYLGKEYVNVILAYSSNSFSAEVLDLGNWDLVDDSYGLRYADPSANLNRCTSDYDITDSGYSIPEFDAMIEKAGATYDLSERYAAYADADCYLLEHAYLKPYMSGGGSYNMTRLVPYTVPGGYFGLSRYKMKGALIQSEPVTKAQHEQLKEKYEAEKAALANN